MAHDRDRLQPVGCRLRVVRSVVVAGAVFGAMALALAGAGSASATPAGMGSSRIRRVLVISVPGLSWTRLLNADAPNLRSLFDQGAVASMAPHSLSAHTTDPQGYATLGAGNRAGADATGQQAYDRDERVAGGTAADLYERVTGTTASGQVLVPAIGPLNHANSSGLYGAQPGLLGQLLAGAGWRRAVIGNADEALPGTPAPPVQQSASGMAFTGAPTTAPSSELDMAAVDRAAALGLMDRHGEVPQGDVSVDVLRRDARYTAGIRLDPARVEAAFQGVWTDRSAVLVELSDVDRADAQTSFVGAGRTNLLAEQALAADDAVVGNLLRHVDLSRDLVMVVAPTAPRTGPQLTPFAIRGPGFSTGVARSAGTRRNGYVELTDVAPTILSSIGADTPAHMTGTDISVEDHRDPAAAMVDLAHANTTAIFGLKMTRPITSLWSSILFVTAVVSMALLAFARWSPSTFERLRWLAVLCRIVLLGVAAYPVLAYLSGLFRYDTLGSNGYTAALLVGSGVIGVAVDLGARAVVRRHPAASGLLAPVTLAGVLFGLLLVDVLTGTPMSFNTVLGNSPIIAGRFAGYGNLPYAFLAASAVVITCGVWGMLQRGRAPTGRRTRWLLGFTVLLFVVMIVFDGLPSLGSDVGGTLTTLPTAAVVVLLLAGYRVTWRRVLTVVGATLGLVVVFTAVDLARPADSRTHLGRLASDILHGGNSMGTLTLQRKIHANLSQLASSWLAPALGVVLALAVIAWLRPLRRIDGDVPGVWASVWGIVVVGVLAAALNDSGISMPAQMAAVYLPFILYLLLDLDLYRDRVVPHGGSAGVASPRGERAILAARTSADGSVTTE